MPQATWTVDFSNPAKKQYEKLKLVSTNKLSIIDTIDFLVLEMQANGYMRNNWPNFSKLGKR